MAAITGCCVIRLQRIYNFWLFHAIILSILDVLWALLCTFILFLGLTYWPRAQCQFLFFPLFQCFEEKEYQTESKQNETFGRVIFGTEAIQETWSRRQGSFEEATRQGGAPYPPGRAPHPRGQGVGPLTWILLPVFLIFSKNMFRGVSGHSENFCFCT